MTLEFGTNLKRLRREKDLTQDELAEKLSLSPQAISRYETGAAYPDIEMLPVIAGFFGVTVDQLLGLSGEAKKQRMREYGDELRKITDRRERLELLRREHAEFPEEWEVVSDMVYEMTYIPECIDEMRKTVADGVRRCDDLMWRENMILWYIKAEPDDSVAEEFIAKNCSRYIMTKDVLLNRRYSSHGEDEKSRRLCQKKLRDELVISLQMLTENPGERTNSKKNCRAAISFISEISANSDPTKPDMWADLRMDLLLSLADNCFALGENEEGYTALENAAALLENTFALPDNTRLTYGTPILDCLSARTKKSVYYDCSEFTDPVPHSMMMYFIYETPIAQADAAGGVIHDMEGFTKTQMFASLNSAPIVKAEGEGFARVKDEDRYRAVVERVKAVTAPATEK